MALTASDKAQLGVGVGTLALMYLYVNRPETNAVLENPYGDAYGGLLSDLREKSAKRRRGRYARLAKKYKKCKAKNGPEHGQCKRLKRRMSRIIKSAQKTEAKVATAKAKAEAKKAAKTGEDFQASGIGERISDVVSGDTPYFTGEGGFLDYGPGEDETYEPAGLGTGVIVGGIVAVVVVAGALGYVLLGSKPKKKKAKKSLPLPEAEAIELPILTSTGPALVPE
jgi:hypothetical protein